MNIIARAINVAVSALLAACLLTAPIAGIAWIYIISR